jgi:hypothetical protein
VNIGQIDQYVELIEPRFLDAPSEGVEFYIQLREAVPYTLRQVGNEIQLELGPAPVVSAASVAPTPATKEVGPSGAGGEPEPAEKVSPAMPPHSLYEAILDEIISGFSYDLRVLASDTATNPISSSVANPQNVLEIPSNILAIQLRPDFFLTYQGLKLTFEPRAITQWQFWDEGVKAGDSDTSVDVFVNQALVGLQMTDSMYASYGREVLLWGPSYLVNPSDPFYLNNGKTNPIQELPGEDFGRFVWVPNPSFSLSMIANTKAGENEQIKENFERSYALKLDYTGNRKFFSLIPSYREHDRAHLGAYAGWTVTDGLLLYGESTLSQGSNVLYPVETTVTTPTGTQTIVRLEDSKDHSNTIETLTVLGATYTFEAGPSLTCEYAWNTYGYSDAQAELALDFAAQLGQILLLPQFFQQFLPISPSNLTQTLNTNLYLLRQHYLLFQFSHPQIRNVLNILCRYTYNLDDNSSQLIPIVTYDLTDHIQLFGVGTQNFGSNKDEFRLFYDYSYFFGLQYTF